MKDEVAANLAEVRDDLSEIYGVLAFYRDYLAVLEDKFPEIAPAALQQQLNDVLPYVEAVDNRAVSLMAQEREELTPKDRIAETVASVADVVREKLEAMGPHQMPVINISIHFETVN